MKKFMITALSAAMVSSVAVADVSVPNIFASGENAVAAEVNGNFGALVAAIEESNARIDALEEQLEKATSLDVTGSNYMVQTFRVQLQRLDMDGGNPTDVPATRGAEIDLSNEYFSLTFNENETVTLDFESEFMGDLDILDGGLEIEEDLEAGTETLNWSQEGNVLQLFDPDEGDMVVEFVVAEGASIIYAVDHNEEKNTDTGFTCNTEQTIPCYEDLFETDTLLGIRQTIAK